MDTPEDPQVDIPSPRADDTLPAVTVLGDKACKARFGVAYVRAIFSQAGFPFKETSPDEDAMAVDGDIDFLTASARVQIKCSSQFKISGRSATWPAEVHWRDRWNKSKIPVYFVLVILEKDDRFDWVEHHSNGTDQQAAAFWVRVDGIGPTENIVIAKDQRLTIDTLNQWAEEVEECFSPR
ncbi:hypothetical protein DMH26_26215 [Streptomyces sp. WAC 05379]|uniref:DUF4365 domain-containing protein n=1 Tax=Streptomyces sp. WAC 05379 TaxID=2203207 RepID=UPI000F73A9A6|nr:DUF4365 domain-containing protein [Streptomyces sp. WAC 05379]RSN91843.1 hypothetical protein DMH26_26215 [Streptomyces sp. WAC 05379]